jgi:hypothetical protein
LRGNEYDRRSSATNLNHEQAIYHSKTDIRRFEPDSNYVDFDPGFAGLGPEGFLLKLAYQCIGRWHPAALSGALSCNTDTESWFRHVQFYRACRVLGLCGHYFIFRRQEVPVRSATGPQRPVVSVGELSAWTSCHADRDGRVRPQPNACFSLFAHKAI